MAVVSSCREVKNAGAADGYTDDLGVSVVGGSGGFALSGGGLLGAGSSATFSAVYNGSTAEAGLKSGTLTLGLVSKGQVGSGLADVSLAPATVNVSATVYRPAVGVLGSTVVDLGNVHVGGEFVPGVIGVRNAVVADGYSEKLNASIGAVSGNAVAGGAGVTLLGAGQTDASGLSVGLSGTGVAGLKSGSARVDYVTDGTGTSGLGLLGVGSETVSVSGKVYRLAMIS